MKVKAIGLILSSAVMGMSGNAAAEITDSRWYIAPALQYINIDNERRLNNDGYGLQINFGRQISDHLNFETGIFGDLLKGDPTDNSELEQYGVNFDLLALTDRSGFQPYVLAGMGFLLSKLDRNLQSNSEIGFHTDLGLGAFLPVNSRGWTVRADARFRTEFNHKLVPGEEKFEDIIYSLGLTAPLGSVPMQVADGDRDGVADSNDLCPNTKPGAIVNKQGCELDSDGDGVADSNDQCPGTPFGTVVNAVGCEASDQTLSDDDNDGVINSADICPNTAAGVRVDGRGCDLKDVIALDGVNFYTDSVKLKVGSQAKIEEAIATLRRYENLNVEIAGHTDNRGPAAYNQKLSQRRANAIMKAFTNAGIDANRLTAQGYGEASPIDSNGSETGRCANRRVELRLQN